MLARWRLVIRVLPAVAIVAALKGALEAAGFEGASFSPLYTGLVAGTIFLLAFLLSGTLADFKESEKLPGDLAASMHAIADECLILHADKCDPAARACLDHVAVMAATTEAWL